MNHASLFSGIGGFDLAAEWMGWQNVMQCEIDPFCQKVLRHHFPSAHLYGDIREIDGNAWRGKIDILTGGFPCQPFSAAGRRRGTEDHRHLWPEMFRVIRESRPTWVVAENVRGLATWNDGLVLESVCSDLEADGYEVQPFCIPACAVDSPHRRERMWFVAHHKSKQNRRIQQSRFLGNTGTAHQSHVTDSGSKRLEGSKARDESMRGEKIGFSRHEQTFADRSHSTCERRECERSSERQPETPIRNGNSNVTDSRCELREQGCIEGMETNTEKRSTSAIHAERCSPWDEPWLQAATRLCRVDDGLPRELDGITVPHWRRESLKAYGNAIVPQVAFKIFKSILS